ncbi:MAG TPA: hypothetical protein VK324_03665, partial [Tepidisphaeraceae bacterium]|nr:hypothetical protein [Tepidisphaeraceae bacterium]
DALAHQLGLDVVATFERSGGDVLIGMLGSAVVRGILLIIFMQSVYIALHAPGHGAAEAVALVSLGLLLGVPALTGYAQWWEIAMILIGLALLATELFVIPGFGVTGITGLVLMAGGFLMTFVAPEPGRRGFSWPALGATWDAVQTGLFVLTGGLVATVLLSAWLRQFLPKLPYLNRLILTPVAGGAGVMGTNVFTGDDVAATWPAPGAVGRAMTDLRPGGSAMFADPVTGGDRAIAVVSDSGFVAAGAAVEVREVGGNRVLVRAAQA